MGDKKLKALLNDLKLPIFKLEQTHQNYFFLNYLISTSRNVFFHSLCRENFNTFALI